MDYKLLRNCLDLLEKSDKEGIKHDGFQDFAIWALQQKNIKIGAKPSEKKTKVKEQQRKSYPLQGGSNAKISQLLALMSKYLRFYVKKAFVGTGLSSADDFGFLATLVLGGDMQKTELIQKNTMELTSGMEVIKRLEKGKLIESFVDPNDRRARRVKISADGMFVFRSILPKMQEIGLIVTARLSEEEKEQLIGLLSKLDTFHNPIFHKEKKEKFETIVLKNPTKPYI